MKFINFRKKKKIRNKLKNTKGTDVFKYIRNQISRRASKR